MCWAANRVSRALSKHRLRNKLTLLGMALVLAGALYSAATRIREEFNLRRTAITVDWLECRLVTQREGRSIEEWIQALYDHGARAIVLEGRTLEELWGERAVLPMSDGPGRTGLDTSRLLVEDPALAHLLYWEWTY